MQAKFTYLRSEANEQRGDITVHTKVNELSGIELLIVNRDGVYSLDRLRKIITTVRLS